MDALEALTVLTAAALVIGLVVDAAAVTRASTQISALGSRILGMRSEEVRDRLGAPTKVATRSTPSGPQEVWQYGALGGCYVAFWAGRVVEAACR